ncbi:hypothetical protein ACIRPK_04035 [Kitasatospora sp. NPDC101801]|uniref:hypothetical protein n=1 Tax=Kitasatospora sp. NPDC101801 TaxID=3364103 RepID=UPI00380B5DF9
MSASPGIVRPATAPHRRAVVTALPTEAEAPVSGAPLHRPATALAPLLPLSPREPTGPRRTGG